jgi:general secretion pathway protein C
MEMDGLIKITCDRISQVAASTSRKLRSGFGQARIGRYMKYSWLYNLLIIALIGYVGMSLFSTLRDNRFGSLPEADPGPEKAAVGKPTPVKPYAAYRGIVERNLFGTATQGIIPMQQEPPPEEVPLAERSVGLKLVGTVISDEPQTSMAVIDHRRSGRQEVYHEGDWIERILIKRIVRNNVIIAMGTEEKRLTMELEDRGDNTVMAARSPGKPASTDYLRTDYRRLSGQRPPVLQNRQTERKAGSTEPLVHREENTPIAIRLAQQEVTSALADTQEATERMKIRPYHPKGDTSGGFLIQSVKPGSIFAKMGLRTGDVVTGLNQEAITGVKGAQHLYSRLREGGKIALEVKRGIRIRQLQLVLD